MEVVAATSDADRLRFYDRTAWGYEIHDPYRRYRESLLALRPPKRGERVLDLFCGAGRNLGPLYAHERGLDVVALDGSSEMLRLARRRAPEFRSTLFVRAEASALTPVLEEHGPFDYVLCTFALTVVPDWRNVVERTWASIRAGGALGVIDFRFANASWACRFFDWLGRADSQRDVFRPLRERASRYCERTYGFLDGQVLVAAADKD